MKQPNMDFLDFGLWLFHNCGLGSLRKHSLSVILRRRSSSRVNLFFHLWRLVVGLVPNCFSGLELIVLKKGSCVQRLSGLTRTLITVALASPVFFSTFALVLLSMFVVDCCLVCVQRFYF